MRSLLLLALLVTVPARAFDATGEIVLTGVGTGNSVAFDSEQVLGPTVNLTRMEGGAWSGDLLGQDVALEVTANRLRAPNVDLYIETASGVTTVRGDVFGRRYSIEYGPKGLSGRLGSCSLDLKRTKTGNLVGPLGCVSRRGTLPDVANVTLRLIGQASEISPPLPQFALALIAVIP